MRKEISIKEARTLFGLFKMRVSYSPDKLAYIYFDETTKKWLTPSWRDTANSVAKWQAALKKENLTKGDRVGLMIRTNYERTLFELATSGFGLVTVPLPIDSFGTPAELVAVLEDTGIKFILIQGELQEKILLSIGNIGKTLKLVRLDQLNRWLPEKYDNTLSDITSDPEDLIAIHYTSGTSGYLKGVMLNHRNLLSNAESVANQTTTYENELLVSFTGGGYIHSMIMDCTTGFPRSIYDLPIIKPTRIISAARLYEYFYEHLHCKYLDNWSLSRFLFKETVKLGWSRFEYKHGRGAWKPEFLLFPILDKIIANPVRNIFGGRLRYGFYAGGILPPEIYKTFIGLGIPVLNCYGQAEAAPVISINTPEDNLPSSIGKPIKGTEVMLKNGELLVKSSGVMMGYWNNPSATESTLKDGWLHTGDMVRIDSDGRLFFIGRMEDVITTKNGDKIAPTEIEAIIKADILFDQAMLIGKDRPFFTALLVLNRELWEKMAKSLKLNPYDPLALKNNTLKNLILNRIAEKMTDYPDSFQIRSLTLLTDEWTAESGLMTISSKLKRKNIATQYAEEINDMYLS